MSRVKMSIKPRFKSFAHKFIAESLDAMGLDVPLWCFKFDCRIG